MISPESLSAEWIQKVSETQSIADKNLIEKVIRALKLLEGLRASGLDFVFKGGTAVMLLQGQPKRFSIDIDILVPEMFDPARYFASMATAQRFTHWEESERAAIHGIEKRHFKFFYTSVTGSGLGATNILLDVVVAKSPYSPTVDRDIHLPFVRQDGPPLVVSVPSAADLLGDKLTAFAPNTTGIPYFKNGQSASLEILKQLFDVAQLFDATDDFATVAATFHKAAAAELAYRGGTGSAEAVLDDVVQTALCLTTQGQAGQGQYRELADGVSRLKSFVFSEKFQGEKAKVHAAKAAYCAALIRTGQTAPERYRGPDHVKDLVVEPPWASWLKGFKKGNPEAYFYWYQTSLLWGGV